MKNNKIVHAFNTIQPNDEVKRRVFNKALQKQQKKRPVSKTAVSFAAAAAVICLILLGSLFLTPRGDNIFVVKAYAMEIQEDGSVRLREENISDTRPEYWGGHVDGETNTMYVGLGLRCEGDDIESVEFSTDDGFFAKQYIGNLADISTNGVPAMYVGPDNRLVVFGNDFDNAGSTISLDKENTDDYLIFWGTSYTDIPDPPYFPTFPEKINIHAKVTFGNGKTAEKAISIDLSGTGVGSYIPSEEQMEKNQREYEAYEKLLRSIPLDRCEVVPDSVQTITYGDTYEYHFDGPLDATFMPITEDAMAAATFDENNSSQSAQDCRTTAAMDISRC